MTDRIVIPKKVREFVLGKYLRRCAYCGIELNIFNSVIDHTTPLSRGGTNEIYNLTPSCSYCNARKSTKNHQEFWEFLNRKIDENWLKRAACNYPVYEYLEDEKKYILHFYWEFAWNQDLMDYRKFEEVLNGAG